MFALRVIYLTLRAVAARFEDGDAKRREEWPPHPGRLFNALVAAWGETGCDPIQRRALEWLEQQSEPAETNAPAIIYSEASSRPIVTVFVPVNDTKTPKKVDTGPLTKSEEEALGVLPEFRLRQPRNFPSLTPTDPEVFFVWQNGEPPPLDLRDALSALAAATTYLGHSASLVSVTLCGDPPLAALTPPLSDAPLKQLALLPDDENGEYRIRVPSLRRLEYLIMQFDKFKANPVKVNRPNAGLSVRYRHPVPVGLAAPDRSVFREMVVFRRCSGDPLALLSTLQLTAAMRGAVLKAAGPNAPEFISGHAPGSTPDAPQRSERPHLGIVPLADVGHTHARGRLLGIAALLPKTLTNEETDRCLELLGQVQKLTMAQAGTWTIEPVSTDTNANALLAPTWTRPSYHWATVTPFVFDRFPKNHHGEEAQGVIRAACLRVGLPTPISIIPVQISPHSGVPPACKFAQAPARPGKPQRWHIHVILCFERPVAGPLAIGAGRYYGYGFCRPL